MIRNITTQNLTLEEALELAQRKPKTDHSSSRERGSWGGVPFVDAIRKATEGDARIALRIQRKLGQYASIRSGAVPSQQWDVSGSAVDIAKYLQGDLECMVETVYDRGPRPVMKIAIERAVSWQTPTEQMENTGVSVLAVVEALRTAGIAAEIWVTFSITGFIRGDFHTTAILVQEAGRPIDVDRLAYWCADPSTLRRIAFAVWEQGEPGFLNEFKIGTSYGRPALPDPKNWDEVAPANDYQVRTWIREVLERRVGVTMTEEVEL